MLLANGDAGAADNSSGTSIRVFKILRLVKLVKLLRVARILRMLERYKETLRSFMKVSGGAALFCAIVLLAHLFACMW